MSWFRKEKDNPQQAHRIPNAPRYKRVQRISQGHASQYPASYAKYSVPGRGEQWGYYDPTGNFLMITLIADQLSYSDGNASYDTPEGTSSSADSSPGYDPSSSGSSYTPEPTPSSSSPSYGTESSSGSNYGESSSGSSSSGGSSSYDSGSSSSYSSGSSSYDSGSSGGSW